MKKLLLLLFAFILSISLVCAVPGDWKGEVTIGGVPAPADTTVKAYSGSTLLASTTTPTTTAGGSSFGDDFYILVFETTLNSTITFKVCGISAAESATFSFGTHTLNLSLNNQSNGIIGCTCDAVCSGGHCVNPGTTTGVCSSNTYYCDSDGTCESEFGETTSTCSADCPSGGGGGGGGGGGFTVTEIKETASEPLISAGSTGSFDFTKSADFAVTQVDITVKDGVSTSSVTIEESTKPSSAPLAIAAADGATYKYLEITLTIPNSNIATATIKFKVAKTWITANYIDSETVALKKLVNNGWVYYATTSSGEDSLYYYYETTVPSFSLYVIVGAFKTTTPVTPTEPTPPVVTPVPPACTPDWGCGSWSECVNGNRARICVDNNSCGTLDGKPAESGKCSMPLKPISVIAIIIAILIIVVRCLFTIIYIQRAKDCGY